MKVLLSDGSGLTARQTATRLWSAGHVVEVLSPDPRCLCRFTRHVRRVHRVPAYGPDPFGWLDAALAVYADGGFDALVPTQEQVAVLAAVPDALASHGLRSAVPPFAGLAAVQDKISAAATLARLGLPQPRWSTDLDAWDEFPAFLKDPIGTASGGVRRVESRDTLRRAGRTPQLVQAAVAGPLAMCQSVFERGALVAFHAVERTGEGANGGASHKRSLRLPETRAAFATLGADLSWHGALSADVILGAEGPQFIDVNPRLVEPANAFLAGVDLVGAMVSLAIDEPTASQPDGRAGVRTHQLLLAVLGAAQHGRRRDVLHQLTDDLRRTGAYAGSAEELCPPRGDPLAVLPALAASLATLARPAAWSAFASTSVANYALTADGWEQILRRAERA